ncbi:hypothetical protein [Fictibacillus fluitans]|uniref:Secreted protein n=1 Tax=Fictibacillus fluitans TaxID=3058422 RepID=A0ABT8I1K8_9BACL|nr:hypothetical protein [Fictibacillus sp. NE201]MDN4526919.1 hypothetical protein [Fictibacillus sp. NE201]
MKKRPAAWPVFLTKMSLIVVDFRFRMLAFRGRALSLTGASTYFLVASSCGNGASASLVSSVPLFQESRTLHSNQLAVRFLQKTPDLY